MKHFSTGVVGTCRLVVAIAVFAIAAIRVYGLPVPETDFVTNTVEITPNPATDKAFVLISLEQNAEIGLTLFASNGKLLFSNRLSLKQGENKIQLDITNLPEGSYHLNLSNDINLQIEGNRQIIKR